uniref:GMC family oxidoreductase N-terminal domain-containing protein n=1 Tax=Geminicoccus flavidas TaxID=2506407 RepID=UPI00135AD232
MAERFDPQGDEERVDADGSGAPDEYQKGEFLNALSLAAYTGRIDRRTFLGTLLKAGVASATAVAWADHAAQAAENQAQRRADLKAGYDYVIVGAGTAGCVLANRLSADRSVSVLLIEAGPGGLNRPQITDPFVWFTNLGSELDWSRPTVPQDRLDDRVLVLPSGRLVGGSSSINALMWLR